MFNLTKHIELDSLRGIGLRASGLPPHHLVVAGLSIQSIKAATGGIAFKIKRINLKNAFCLCVDNCHFLYVRPSYSGYRRLAKLRFREIQNMRDVDHVLARTLAAQMSINYVLVALVSKSANRAHGNYEKIGVKKCEKLHLDKVIYADARIFHKVLSRPPTARQSRAELRTGFDRNIRVDFGLTLKQQGQWNIALGFDCDTPDEFLQLLQPI